MAYALDSTLKEPKYQNWLKGYHALSLCREGLLEFVEKESKAFKNDLMQSVFDETGISETTTCSVCTTANVLKCPTKGFCGEGRRCNAHDKTLNKQPNRQCLKGICSKIRDKIRQEHRYKEPSWKNTDARKWCFDEFQLIKCYMPCDGYVNKSSLMETDLNGILSVIITNKRFDAKFTSQLSMEPNVCSRVRQVSNVIRHSADCSNSENDFASCIDAILDLLRDPKYLLNDQKAQEAVLNIKKLKDTPLVILSGDLLTDLKEDLINHYQDYESTSCIDECDVHLLDLYVHPPMVAYKKPDLLNQIAKFESNTDRQNKAIVNQSVSSRSEGNDKWHISSYVNLFFKNENDMCRDIYVSAKAGMGKTTFCQYLALAWCQAHRPDISKLQTFRKEDLNCLIKFDFLFLVHLRAVQGFDFCNIDNMVYKMLSDNLSRSTHFTVQFLQHVLHSRRCLFVLDGLDEWTHPDSCTRKPEVPHNNHSSNCVVLTTSRPWKLSTVRLTQSQIDRYIEISELSVELSNKLENNALTLLTRIKESTLERNNIFYFHKEISSVKLGDFQNIPYVKLHLLCLWRDGIPIGRSRCEIFSNIVHFALARGLSKKSVPIIPTSHTSDLHFIPVCMKNKDLCKRYIHSFTKLGRLAFFALFGLNKNLKYAFKRDTVKLYLEENEIDFFLKVGLLSQNKDTSRFSHITHMFYFEHISMQEFFAGLYISTQWNKKEIQTYVMRSCKSIPDMLEKTDVFIFVSGMNPEIYYQISCQFQNVVDTFAYDFRRSYSRCQEKIDALQQYQSLQISCVEESVNNGNNKCQVTLKDLFLSPKSKPQVSAINSVMEDNLTHLASLVQNNNLKSIFIDKLHGSNAGFLTRCCNDACKSLETLRIHGCDSEMQIISKILVKSCNSLKYLFIREMSINNSISTSIQLRYLRVFCVTHSTILHESRDFFFGCISNMKLLQQLKLQWIKNSSHPNDVIPKEILELFTLNKLQTLHLGPLRLRNLRVNMERLEECYIVGKLFTETALSSMFADVRGAQLLSTLVVTDIDKCVDKLIDTVPSLKQLHTLRLYSIDLGGNELVLSRAMTNLTCVTMNKVAMTVPAWKSFLLEYVTMLSPSLNVELVYCKGPSKNEWEQIVNDRKLTSAFEIVEGPSFSNQDILLSLLPKVIC